MAERDEEKSIQRLDAIVRWRRLDEQRALTDLAEKRRVLAANERRIAEIRARKSELIARLESGAVSAAASQTEDESRAAAADPAKLELRRRLDDARRSESEAAARAKGFHGTWTASVERFTVARTRRQVFDTLRGKREAELRSKKEKETERLVEEAGRPAVSWQEPT